MNVNNNRREAVVAIANMSRFNPTFEKKDLEDLQAGVDYLTAKMNNYQRLLDVLGNIQERVLEIGTQGEIVTFWKVKRALRRKVDALEEEIREDQQAIQMHPFLATMDDALETLAGDLESADGDELLSDDEEEDDSEMED